MSWDAYVQSLLHPLANGHALKSGAICGLDGGIWAQSAEFPPATTEQILAIVSGFTPEGLKKLQDEGSTFKLGDRKCLIIGCDDGIIRAKQEKDTLIIQRTNTAMVVGIGTEPDKISGGEISQIVATIAETLLQYNY